MKIWKKIGLGVAVLSSLVVLASCGSNSGGEKSSNGKVTIQFMHWGGSETYKGSYKDRIAAFEKANPKIKVKVITIGDDYDTKLQTMVAGNKAPDVAQVAENGTGFATKNAFIDLNSRIKKDNIDLTKKYGGASALYKWDGKTFGIPDRGGSGVLFYNKDLFDKAGISYPDSNWTIADFYSAAKKLTKDTNGDGKIDQWGTNYADYQLPWGSFVMTNGGSVIKNKKAVVDSPQNVKTFKAYLQGFKDSSVPYQTSEDGVNRFQSGKVGISLDGMWWIRSNADIKGLNFGIAPMPGKYTWSTGSALTISKQSSPEKQDAAWKFIKYMTDDKAQQILGKSLYDVPADLDVLDSADFQNQTINGKKLDLKVIAENQKKVKIDGILKGPWYSEAMTACGNQVKEMLLGHQSAEKMVKVLQGKLTSILGKY